MSLTNEQLILLDNLIYLDDTVNLSNVGIETIYVRDVVDLLLEKTNSNTEFEVAITDEQFYYCKDMVNGMNAEQWKTILNAIASDETLMNMKITNVVDENDYNIDDDDRAKVGVYGNRWLNDQSQFSKYINDYWIRPLDSEKPKGLEKVENGCYW